MDEWTLPIQESRQTIQMFLEFVYYNKVKMGVELFKINNVRDFASESCMVQTFQLSQMPLFKGFTTYGWHYVYAVRLLLKDLVTGDEKPHMIEFETGAAFSTFQLGSTDITLTSYIYYDPYSGQRWNNKDPDDGKTMLIFHMNSVDMKEFKLQTNQVRDMEYHLHNVFGNIISNKIPIEIKNREVYESGDYYLKERSFKELWRYEIIPVMLITSKNKFCIRIRGYVPHSAVNDTSEDILTIPMGIEAIGNKHWLLNIQSEDGSEYLKIRKKRKGK